MKLITWMYFIMLTRKPIAITRLGIHFNHEGDEVVWMWRKWNGMRWYSIEFGGTYPSLEALDDEWDRYFTA